MLDRTGPGGVHPYVRSDQRRRQGRGCFAAMLRHRLQGPGQSMATTCADPLTVDSGVESQKQNSAPPGRWRARVWRIVRSLLIIYLLVTLVISMLQEWLIFPGQGTQGRAEAQFTVPSDSELLHVTSSNGDRVAMLLMKASAESATRPTIIFFYGNAMCLADAVDFCRAWRKLGANVVGVEYPGY